MKAYVMVRDQPHYRRDAFMNGLKRAGYDAHFRAPDPARPGDVLAIWNRYGHYHQLANQFERQGGTVLVAENGYLGVDAQGIQMYALAIHGHNGSGWWPEGEEKRFPKLGVEVKQWRSIGEHVYVRGQRGIGSTEMASPPDWHTKAAAQIRRQCSRRVVVAEHPGKPAVDPEQAKRIASAIAGAHACVIWSSATGVRALVEGIPVFFDAPHWICEGAAQRGLSAIEVPVMDDLLRERALERMAWGQWSVAELNSGEPFLRLAECDRAQRGADSAADVKVIT